MTAPTNKSYASGNFELTIDGHKPTSYLKSVEGGAAKANIADDPKGGNALRVKHLANIEYEPLKVEFAPAGANEILQWIQGSWKKKFGRRSGHISHADFNLKRKYETWFYDALITETTFPTLDGSAKEPGWIKCTFQPERMEARTVAPDPITAEYTTKEKFWSAAAFRLNIDQIDGMQYTNKIDSFTIKQGIKKMFVGHERFPQLEPTKVEFPNLSGTISLAYADSLLAWHNKYVERGQPDNLGELSGSIEFLTPDRAQTIFSIELMHVGLMGAQIMPSGANAESIKRVKFDLFVNEMKLDGPGSLGLE
jgi:hypothetical protein